MTTRRIVGVLFFVAMTASALGATKENRASLGMQCTFHHSTDGLTSWIVVQALTPGGPAEAAGLKRGDIVTAIAERPLSFKTDREALLLLIGLPVDAVTKLSVTRDRKSIQVSLVPRPMSDEQYENWKTMFALAPATPASKPASQPGKPPNP